MEISDVVNRIELKIKGIKERLTALQDENNALKKHLELLQHTLYEKQTLITGYEKNTYINNTNNNNGSDKAKQKIEEILREIDKCIALLSSK
jgi:regulator of replication initiation timing